MGKSFELIDGGYCANNPTLYAIADAAKALGRKPPELRVVSVGVWRLPGTSLVEIVVQNTALEPPVIAKDTERQHIIDGAVAFRFVQGRTDGPH